MNKRINLALLEAVYAQKAAEAAADRAGRPALHPMAEYYGDRERARVEPPAEERSFTLSMTGDDE